ncbi:BTAD domain-containing putative transcriptional regulator [Kitasatospora sp. NPDC048540]|uniref:AfsR/SARP family transcriptional regulator n=1 Tax=unclassified Kitasatospora TaxID=2633591 RepID=UPI00053AA3BA
MGMRFGVLGPLTVHDDHGPRPVTGEKVRLLLAALLLHGNHVVSAEQLRRTLWCGGPPRTARSALHNHAARLRQALGPQGGGRVRAVPSGYLIEVLDGELDADAFVSHLRRARAARSERDRPTARSETAAALARWRGRPLADLPALADRPEVAGLVEQHLQALEWHYEDQLQLGRTDGLAADLATLVAENPLKEAFHRQLMLVLHRSGRTAEALAVHQRLRRTLVDELGIEPGPAVRQAHREVLGAPPAPAQPVAGPPTAGPPTVARPVPGPVRTRSQLPRDLPDFTGRGAELDALQRQLGAAGDPAPPKVLVVSGMAGIGKTALAVHAAHGLRSQFPDGRLHADLRGLGPGPARNPFDLLARLLTDLGLPDRDVPRHADDRVARYRALLADRRVLIVLDDARDARQVAPLVPGTGGSAVIVTSRRPLAALPGAARITLGPLTRSEQYELLAAVCGAELIAADRRSADRILDACAGLPLAVRIAAARLAGRPAAALGTLARRLSRAEARLDLLAVDHLAVRESFSTSYDALRTSSNPLEREAARAFRLLGLRPDRPLSLRAASALLDEEPDRAADLLDVLVDAQLLQRPRPDSYGFHDLIGEFSAERAAREEAGEDRERALSRLLSWCAAGA